MDLKVGTGIFTTPGAVLASTGSKGMSVALWTVGGLWTALLYVNGLFFHAKHGLTIKTAYWCIWSLDMPYRSTEEN